MNIHIHHFHSKGALADEAALEQFQKQWATYQKLVDADSLAHKEVGAILHGALAAIPKPFAFVDIACGDAGQMKHALAGSKASHYHGIDLSEPALELAYEPTRLDGEDRDDYLARFRRVNRPAWNFFTPEEWAQIDHHVTTCDYPETSATWVALGREAGFAEAREIFCDPTGFYRIYRYDC